MKKFEKLLMIVLTLSMAFAPFMEGMVQAQAAPSEGTMTITTSDSEDNSTDGDAAEESGESSEEEEEEVKVAIDETNFPDAVFRKYVSKYIDKNVDGSLSESEMASVRSLSLSDQGISDLTGIGNFPNLTILTCSSNSLTALDLSDNTNLMSLYCSGNSLTSLDVSMLSKLEVLGCGSNKLKKLDVSGNTALLNLNCSGNKLTFLDVSNNSKLTYLDASDNSLSSLDLSGLTSLTTLIIKDNPLFRTAVGLSLQPEKIISWPYAGNPLTYTSSGEKLAEIDSTGTVTATAGYGKEQAQYFTGRGTVGDKTVYISFSLAVLEQFSDVTDTSSYFFKPVYWAAENGITTGRSARSADGTKIFDPWATCTRAEIVTFLWRLAGKPSPEASECVFTDVAEDAYYYKAVQWAYEQGITTGRRGTTNFDPSATCTRREIVTFLWRYAGEPAPGTVSRQFDDVTDSSAYYYNAVYWAYKNKITTGKTGTNNFDPKGLCTRGMAVTFIYRYAN